MGYVALSSAVSVGKFLKCKYPKHGRMNILKWIVGEVEKVGDGPNGKYALVRSPKGEYRTLRYDRMVDAKVADPVVS